MMRVLRGRPVAPLWLIALVALLIALWAVYQRAGLPAVGLLLVLVGVLMLFWVAVSDLRS